MFENAITLQATLYYSRSPLVQLKQVLPLLHVTVLHWLDECWVFRVAAKVLAWVNSLADSGPLNVLSILELN
jgi:hypothetical protein